MSTAPSPATVYCQRCGAAMAREERFCRSCGTDSTTPWGAAPQVPYPAAVSDRKRLVALLLCIFLGVFGAHRFYVGKIGTGVIWLFTLSLLGVGMLFDLILIIAGEFRDKQGHKVIVWSN